MEFFNSAIEVLQTLVVALGAGMLENEMVLVGLSDKKGLADTSSSVCKFSTQFFSRASSGA